MRKRISTGLLGLSVLLATSAAVPAEGDTPPARPRLALVLSGGGARGAAHIGVLKVMEELHVVPDIVVGTSMGSIVGGLYATGWKPEEIEEFLQSVDWSQVFSDQVERNDRSFRRKQDDRPYLVQAKIRFKKLKPYMPPGLLGGQRLELMLQSLEFESTGQSDFDKFPVPYRAVAVDIATGEIVVLDHGSLATAMRASMSISGAFPPVELDGHTLVDGGAAANLPVGVAQSLGAERIIAVDISSPLDTREELGSFLSFLNQMSGLLTVGNVQQDKKRLRPGDLYLQPQLGDIKFSDFARAKDAVAIGEKAAREQIDRLREFRASDEAWAAFLKRRAERPPSDFTVTDIKIANRSWVSDEVIRRRLELKTGQKLNDIGLSEAVMKVYALDYFGKIRPSFERTGTSEGTLGLDVPQKPYGRNLLQVGLGLQADWMNGGRGISNAFSLTARHQVLAVDRLGAELQNVVRMGQDSLVSTQFYQPLDSGMRWFVEPAAYAARPTYRIWVDGKAVAEYGAQDEEVGVSLGRVFEHWGEIRVTPYFAYSRGDATIGVPTFPSLTGHDGGVRAQFRVDTYDNTTIPEKGTSVTLRYVRTSESLGADQRQRQVYGMLSQAMSSGRNIVLLGVEGLRDYDPLTTFRAAYFLGGAGRLSGLGDRELIGDRGGIARILYYYRLVGLTLGPIKTKMYAGVSLEAGGVVYGDTPLDHDALRRGGSLFAAATTPIGPAYLGWGYTNGGRSRIYLSIGREL